MNWIGMGNIFVVNANAILLKLVSVLTASLIWKNWRLVVLSAIFVHSVMNSNQNPE
jgi:hypothetical protein